MAQSLFGQGVVVEGGLALRLALAQGQIAFVLAALRGLSSQRCRGEQAGCGFAGEQRQTAGLGRGPTQGGEHQLRRFVGHGPLLEPSSPAPQRTSSPLLEGQEKGWREGNGPSVVGNLIRRPIMRIWGNDARAGCAIDYPGHTTGFAMKRASLVDSTIKLVDLMYVE